jgi:multidrug efflux pump subunit AcrA (membrane-fusion protein)
MRTLKFKSIAKANKRHCEEGKVFICPDEAIYRSTQLIDCFGLRPRNDVCVTIFLLVLLLMCTPAAFAADSCAGEHGEHGEHSEHNEISVNKKSQDLVDIKTVKAALSEFAKKISVVGQISQDAEETVNILAPRSGSIAECRVEAGSQVKKGDLLCLVRPIDGGADIDVVSSIPGVVIGSFVKTGDKVDTVSSLYTIADLSKLGATFDVYEKDIRYISLGQKICARSIAYPEKCFEGGIVFISPRVERDTNSIKVRAVVENPNNMLKLGAFLSADIIVKSDCKYVVLPLQAIHSTGDKREVIVKTGDDKFSLREVKVADQSGDEVSICSGINEGEEVVTENGFLLKSELLKSKMGAGCAE